jgi:hypothetical protein
MDQHEPNDMNVRRSANTPLYSIFEPKEKYTDNIGKVIHLRPIEISPYDKYTVLLIPQSVFGFPAHHFVLVITRPSEKEDKIYSMGFYGHPEKEIITLASPDRNIITNEDLYHAARYYMNSSNTFKILGSKKATKLNHLISHYTHGEYIDSNVKAGNNKDNHKYGLLSNNCITGFIDIFREDIPMNKLSTIEQTFISRAETNKTLKHAGKKRIKKKTINK